MGLKMSRTSNIPEGCARLPTCNTEPSTPNGRAARTTSIGQPGISALLKKISTLPGQNKRVRDLRTQCRHCGLALKHNATRLRVLNLHSQFSNIHIQSTTSTPQRDVPTPSFIILFPAIHELRRLCTSSRYSSSSPRLLSVPSLCPNPSPSQRT